MTRIYDEVKTAGYKKDIRNAWIVSVISLVLFYGIAVTLCFFLKNDATFKLFTVIMVLSSSIGGIIFLYRLFTVIIPDSKKLKFITEISSGKTMEISGVITDISKEITIAPYVVCLEVGVEHDGTTEIIYLDKCEKDNVEVGREITARTYLYRVIEYEVR